VKIRKVVVGSTNPVKVAAVTAVLRLVAPEVSVIGLAVASGVAEQPWGDEETQTGAVQRAEAALAADREADWGIGVEGGIIQTAYGVFSNAWCAIVDRAGRRSLGGSVGLPLPPLVVTGLYNGGELGPLMDELTGISDTKTKMGASGILTRGLIDRQASYEVIIKYALARFLHPDWYENSPGKTRESTVAAIHDPSHDRTT